jgi:serine/threonine protein kinase
VLLAIGRFGGVIGIEELHKHDIVYRDLKLDNIMISSDGHVKVSIYFWVINIACGFWICQTIVEG